MSDLSVVIPSYRAAPLLRRCLRSVASAQAAWAYNVEVIVVDDGSGDETPEMVAREFPDVVLVTLSENRGYPAAVNAGVARASAEWVLTLNNDTTVDQNVFDALLQAVEGDPALGLAAAQQRFSRDPEVIYSAGLVVDRAAQVSDRLIGEPAMASEPEPVEVFGACGAAALYRRSMLAELGGFDERFEFGLEDADIAWRARMRGWRCLYVPAAIVYHDLGGTVAHGSPRRLYQAGRNRWLLIAKNLDGAQLRGQLPAIVAFDLAYLLYACLRYRSLAPLRGRIAGLRMWRTMRRAGAPERRPVELAELPPLRGALRRRALWRRAGSREADRRRVLLLNQYVPPDPASTGRIAMEVAAALAAAGDEVTFLGGQPSYRAGQPGAPRRELVSGVEVRRLALPRRGGRSTLPSRLAGYLGYLLGAATLGRLLVLRRGSDTVVAFHNPPLLPLIGAFVARGRRFVAVVQDIHPDVITASGWRSLPRPLLNLWDRLNRWALARADRVLVLSEGMREVLAEKGITRDRVSVIPLWATPELTGDGAPAAAPEPAPDDPAPAPASAPHELTLFLGGNLGLTQQLDPLLEAMRLLRDEPVRLCITAEGVQADRWRQRADGIEAVSFLPFQSDAGYRAQVAGAGAAVVTLAPGLERLLVPSRAYPPMSAGVPLVAVMSADSEIGRLVIQHGAGVCSTDPGELAAAIRRWVHEPAARAAAGERAAQAYWQGGGRAALLARYVELIRG